MFDDVEKYPFCLKRGGQKEAGRLEGSCHSFEPPCKEISQMNIKSCSATTVFTYMTSKEIVRVYSILCEN